MAKQKQSEIDDVLYLPLRKSFLHRLPWLLIGLLGGILAARIIKSFEETISKNLFLSFYIPLIVYMSDAVGTQTEAFVIRDFALHPKRKLVKYFLKHFTVIFAIASILSLVLFFITFYSNHQFKISIVTSVSLFFAVMSSIISGLILPLVFKRSKLDPANASGPIATVIQDILSVFIYLSIANFLLG